MSERSFRFGIPIVHDGSAEELREEARAAEGLGYSTLQVFDQLTLSESSPTPALAFVAAATRDIRLCAYVFDNGYRHPLVLAKEAAVLDRLSGGRLELGLGAGWSELEYAGSGIPFAPGPERVSRLEEAIALIKRVYSEGPATYEGTWYRLTEYALPTKPLQQPWPPLMIAGARRRLLSLAGREADIVSLSLIASDFRGSATLGATRQKLAWVREAAGPRFGDLEIEALVQCRFGASREAAAAEAHARTGAPIEVLMTSPHVLLGTAEEMAETLDERRRDLGINYISVRPRQVMRGFAAVIRLLT